MKNVNCPKCNFNVDLSDKMLIKVQDGPDLIITCPTCNTKFIILQTGITKIKEEEKVKVKLTD